MGNDGGKAMGNVTGGGPPARLWRDFMKAAHAGTPPRALPGLTPAPALPAALAPEEDGRGFWRNFLATLSGNEG